LPPCHGSGLPFEKMIFLPFYVCGSAFACRLLFLLELITVPFQSLNHAGWFFSLSLHFCVASLRCSFGCVFVSRHDGLWEIAASFFFVFNEIRTLFLFLRFMKCGYMFFFPFFKVTPPPPPPLPLIKLFAIFLLRPSCWRATLLLSSTMMAFCWLFVWLSVLLLLLDHFVSSLPLSPLYSASREIPRSLVSPPCDL